jgi:FkbM family methyltransferase
MKQKLKFTQTTCEVVIKNPTEHIQKHWAQGNFYEASRIGVLNYVYSQEPNGGVYIDIGASIGNHTLFFAMVKQARMVLAFEPYLPSYEHLEENLKLNQLKNVYTFNVALGSEDKEGMMIPINTANVGMVQVAEGKHLQGEACVIKTLDSFDIPNFDVMKIDAEHYNEELLKGAKETLTRGTGNVYIECETKEILELTNSYMKKYGYKLDEKLVFNHTPSFLWRKVK